MLNQKRIQPLDLMLALAIGGLYLTNIYSRFLFHSLAEIFRIAVAVAVFMLVWNVRQSLDNTYLKFIGVAYVFVCSLDILHTIASQETGVFGEAGANLAAQLWIGARCLEGASLLLAPFSLGRKLKMRFVLAAYAAATSLLLAIIFYRPLFPAALAEGTGLTPFAKLSGLLVVFMFVASMALLIKKRDQFDLAVRRLLVTSIAFTVLSELCLSFYAPVQEFRFFLGHVFKIIAFYCIYKAIIETGLARPLGALFRNLKASEDALRKERDFIAGVLSTGDVMVAVLDREGRIVRANKAAERLTGYSFEELRGKQPWNLIVPDEAEEMIAVLQEINSTGVPSRREYSFRAKDGRRFQVLWSSSALTDEAGRVEYLVVSGIDITERKRAEESLRESQALFQKLAQVSPVGIFRTDADGQCIYVNERWQTIAGLSMENALGRGWTSAIHPEDRDRVASEWYASAERRTPFQLEYRFNRPDGVTTWLMGQATAETDSQGRVVGYVGTITDITERKRAEEALSRAYDDLEARVQERTRELAKANELLMMEINERRRMEEALRHSETKYRTVADNTYDWEWWRDSEGRFIYASPSCRRITHHKADEFIADPDLLLRIIHPDDRPSFISHHADVEEKAVSGELEFRIVRPDGSVRWLAHACQPVLDENGRPLGRRGSNRDITERKRAEESLRESEQQLRHLSSQILTAQETERRRISRELHDELGGALAVLKLRTSSVEKNLRRGQENLREECRLNLQHIDQIIENVARISRDLSPSILEDIGLTPALRWLIDNFVKNYKIKVSSDLVGVDHLFPRDLQIMIYRVVQEALTNIGKHARAKKVSIKARKGEDRVSFVVEDDGRGFDTEYARTRAHSDRGLGLATMDERARMLGGSLDIWSESGKGTRIALIIPLSKGDRV